ncbi:hypothetical protein LQ327_01365 [Actinomycetospora endophytica]|uniref:STAS domain-containing protein n=1 Tax=Actinomycetospora endophytica TaxID=2291215 RepID=A0ABS8P4Q2_9PSEU|nr:hypothetical protein [Actinomycetospora endophytica]MCD2192039.1 hypothetical protein [Actinomycetospora endophytica]
MNDAPAPSRRDTTRPTAPFVETLPSPSALITRRVASDAASVVVAIAGDVGAHDATVLHHWVRTEIDNSRTEQPQIVVVILTEVTSFAPGLPEALHALRRHAREIGVGLHLLDFGRSGLHRILQDERS